MLELFNDDSLTEQFKAEDIFSGDDTTTVFSLVNLSDNVARVYVDGVLLDSEDYTVADNSGWEITFDLAPASGTDNIILQSDDCPAIPSEGSLNGYSGDSEDVNYFINNNDSGKGYTNVTITPIDHVGTSEVAWVKLAESQEDLDTATAGEALNLGTIDDDGVAHGFWARITVPAGTLGLNDPTAIKYDLCFEITGEEYDI